MVEKKGDYFVVTKGSRVMKRAEPAVINSVHVVGIALSSIFDSVKASLPCRFTDTACCGDNKINI